LGNVKSIRLVGHTGEITALGRLHAKSMFVFDANTALTLIRHVDQQTRLDDMHFRLLRETRQRIRRQWTERGVFLPVDPVLGLMELTKQDSCPNFSIYLPKFEHFFSAVYGVNNYDRAWVRHTYEPVIRLLSSVHQSISLTLHQILSATPTSGKLDAKTILVRIENFLSWVLANRNQLAMVGGPLLQLAVYAIAGSPEAHRFLKIAQVSKTSPDVVARNVAWDFMHWVNLDFHYQYAKYPSTIVCTSDQALADFLLARRNLGPRAGREVVLNAGAVNSFGDITFPKLSRLDDTFLGDEIAQRLLDFWCKLSQDPGDEVWFTPFGQTS
jgi:hypothetical protein